MKRAFFTISTDGAYSEYAQGMINSFEKFNPNDPLIWFKQSDVDEAIAKGYYMGCLYPYFGEMLTQEFDQVISIEPDSVVCGPLDEISALDPKTVGVVRNNLDDTLGLRTREMDRLHYVNSGLVASGNKDFWRVWRDKSLQYAKLYYFVEQDVLNYVLPYSDFKYTYLDEKDVFYGSSFRRAWDDMRVEGNKIVCAGRTMKVLHWAGGPKNKMDWWGQKINPEVCKKLDELIAEVS